MSAIRETALNTSPQGKLSYLASPRAYHVEVTFCYQAMSCHYRS